MGCKVSGVDNPESVKVTSCSTNIVDILNGDIRYKTVTIREKTENTLVLSCTGTYKGVCYILPKNLVGKYLTISGEWDNANGAKGGLRLNWIKNNNVADMTSTQIWTSTSGKVVSGLVNPPPEDAACLGLMVYGNSDGSIEGEGVVSYRNIQVEIGSTATEYEPYNAQTLTPNADGIVEGMTSVSPYMHIFTDTDGVDIEVEYNKSWGMQTEYDRFWDYYQDNGYRKDYNQAFSGWGWYTDTFKPKYDMHPTSAVEMFKNWNFGRSQVSIKQLLDSAGITLDLSKATSLYGFANSSTEITEFGVIDVSSATTCYAMFNYATWLRKVEKLIISNTTTNMSEAFAACRRLTDIILEGCVAVSINFKDSPLTKASITSIINTLSTTSTGQTLTLNLAAVNTAFETSAGAADGSTSAEFATLVATKTNWTITMI